MLISYVPYQLLVLSLHTSNYLHKLRASHSQKRHLGLSGYSLSQQGLPAAWRPKQQCTLGNLGSQLQVSLWILTIDNIVVSNKTAMGTLKVLLMRDLAGRYKGLQFIKYIL